VELALAAHWTMAQSVLIEIDPALRLSRFSLHMCR
jgi:hypothetical protein